MSAKLTSTLPKGKVIHKIAVDDLRSGMKFDDPICHSSGTEILSAGVELTEGMIKILKGRGVSEVYTESEPYVGTASEADGKNTTAKGYIQRRSELSQVEPGMELAQPVYKDRKVLIEEGVVLSERHLSRLKEWGIDYLQVRESVSEIERLIEERERVKSICRDVHHQALDVVQESMENVLQGNIIEIQSVETSIKGVVEQASADKDMLINSASIESMDDYLLAHSVGVAIYSVVMGLGLGYKEDELTLLGMGALLHDIGMTKVPADLIDRGGPLNAAEYDEVKRHTLYGTMMVKDGTALSKQVKKVISRHHERYDGSGYPQRLEGAEIDEYSQIVGLADTFEAMTSPRSYREKMTVYHAMRETLSVSPKAFNPTLTRALLEKMALYPVGSLVELSSGQMAIVVGTNDKVPFRPVVRIVSEGEEGGRKDLRIINLLGDENLYIVGILREEDYDISVVDEF